MGGMFSAPKMQAPAPAPPPPTRSDVDVQDAALAERRRRNKAKGRASTILTSGQGVTDETKTEPKKLLGN